jgi:PAS domain S-box-containing protein
MRRIHTLAVDILAVLGSVTAVLSVCYLLDRRMDFSTLLVAPTVGLLLFLALSRRRWPLVLWKKVQLKSEYWPNFETVLASIFDSNLNAVLFIDNRLIIKAWNRAAGKWAELIIGQELKTGMTALEVGKLFGIASFENLLLQALSDNTLNLEHTFKQADSSERAAEFTFIPVFDLKKRCLGVCINFQDITSRKRVETALATSLSTYKTLMEVNPDLIFRINREGLFLDSNHSERKLQYLFHGDISGKKLYEVLPAEIAGPAILQAFETGKIQTFEYQLELSGYVFSFECRVLISGNDEAILIVREITEQKQVQQALLVSESRYREVVGNIKEVIYRLDQEGRWVFLNQAFSDITDISLEEGIGRNCEEFFHPDDRFKLKEALNNLTDNRIQEYNSQLQLLTRERNYRRVEFYAKRIGDENGINTGISGAFRDITAQYLSEEKLNYRYEFEKLLASISNSFINLGADETDLEVKRALEKVGLFTGAERSYIFRFLPDGSSMSNIYEWCLQGIEPQLEMFQNLPLSEFQWIIGQLLQLQPVHIPCLNSLPDSANNEREFLQKYNIKSLILIPLVFQYKPLGFLGFDAVTFNRSWSDDNIIMLKVVGEIFTRVLKNQEAEKALVEQRDFAALVMDTMGQGLSIQNLSGEFRYVNHAFAELLGYNQARLIGTNLQKYLSPGCSPEALNIKETINFDTSLIRSDGQELYVNITAVPLYRDNVQEGIVSVTTDLTERKRTEEEVRQNLQKERELSELKTRFITMASHEFRTPLTTILSSAELLEFYVGRWSEARVKELYGRIRHSVGIMTELLDEVLLINKVEAGKLEYRLGPLKVKALCAEIAEEVALSSGKERIWDINLESDEREIWGDERLMRQVLANLLTNAIKYSSSGSRIKVAVCYEQERAKIVVADEGIGIPPEAMEHLFEVFYRAENVGDIKGTGLGLAIVKKCLEVQGGSIRIESTLEKGTVCIIEMPLKASAPGK